PGERLHSRPERASHVADKVPVQAGGLPGPWQRRKDRLPGPGRRLHPRLAIDHGAHPRDALGLPGRGATRGKVAADTAMLAAAVHVLHRTADQDEADVAARK